MIAYLKKHGWSLFLLLLLLGVAAYFRLHDIAGYMTFLGDEGRDVMVVRKMIMTHRPTFLGPTASVGGFFLGPIYYYFMVPFLWLWKFDPVGPAVMVGLFGVATVYLVYRVGKDFFGEAAGFTAASLYALSPLVIAYSRSSWNPNLVPFFSLLLVYLLWRVVAKQEKKNLFWIGIVLGIGLQLHYLFLFLFAVVGVWFLLYGRSKTMIRYYLFAIVGFMIGFGPFLAFEIYHQFPNFQSILRFLGTGQDTGFSFMVFLHNIQDVAFRLFGRLVLRLPDGAQWGQLTKPMVMLWTYGTYAFIAASIAMVGFAFKQKKTDAPTRTALMLLIVWFGVLLFMFGMYKRAIYDYYLGVFFVVPFLCVGLMVSWLIRTTIGKIVAAVLVALLLFFNWQGRPFLYQPNNQLAQAKRIAKVAFEKAEGKPFNFALLTGGNSDHAYRYFFEVWGNAPVTIDNGQIDPERKTVTEQLIIICEEHECKPLGHPLWEIAGFGPAEIVGEWDVPFVKIFKLVHYKEQ